MEIETFKDGDKENAPVMAVYDVKLKVGDGVRFGFGFGLGMIIWGIIFLVITYFGVNILMSSFTKSIKLF